MKERLILQTKNSANVPAFGWLIAEFILKATNGVSQ